MMNEASCRKGRLLFGCKSIFVGAVFCASLPPCTGAEPTKDQAREALRKAVVFFQSQVSASGGYLWRYSADLKYGEGEGRASPTTVWIQPPGTPSVGEVFLTAYRATGDKFYLDAALETVSALVNGQLESGGWDYRIEFGEGRDRYRYLVEPSSGDSGRLRNVTTLDDNTTQAALRFLMHVDQALDFKDQQVHAAAAYALDRLLAAQYPNGAWPQRFSEPPDPAQYPVIKANYPESWPREHPDQRYQGYYTFNDNSLADMIEVLFEAARIYDDERFMSAAERAGDFILLSQMPDPQPAWAQQYNAQMQPAWARRFEPASVTGGESQGVLSILMGLYQETGEEKYLEPIPRCLDYLQSSLLADGRLARFYELKTNRPLYFTREYVLTYDDGDVPTHYAFKVSSRLDRLRRDYNALKERGPQTGGEPEKPRLTDNLASRTERAIDGLDERGAWVTQGSLSNYEEASISRVIDCREFIRNVETLCDFIVAER